MERIVVVGASLAGVRAAEAIRDTGFGGTLTLVGAEVDPPYSRPPLSKQLLAATMERDATTLRHTLDATWLLGVSATALHAVSREVELSTGETLSYDGLVIATGCTPRPWNADLPELQGLVSLRNLDDALTLRALIARRPPVVVIGAGFIGCEVAATLRGLDVAVTLVDVASRPMVAMPAEVGQLMADIHHEHGVDLRLGVGVVGFEGRRGRLEAVQLADGTRVEAHVALFATGVAPSTQWLRGSGLTTDPGVVCDVQCRAIGAEDVVGAGDVAHWPHPLAGGELIRVEHWSNAAAMGRVAGRNLVVAPQERTAHTAMPSFWTDQYGLKIQAAGFLHLAERLRVIEGTLKDRRFVALGERDGRPIGAVAMNNARRLRHYRALISAT